jgi:hypothetical protein
MYAIGKFNKFKIQIQILMAVLVRLLLNIVHDESWILTTGNGICTMSHFDAEKMDFILSFETFH